MKYTKVSKTLGFASPLVVAFVVHACKPLTVDDVRVIPTSFSASSSTSITGTVNQNVASPGAVIVRDQNSEPVPGLTVTYAASAGTVAPQSVTTNASGQAQATSWTLPTASGTHTLTATLSGASLAAVVFTATVNPGPAASQLVAPGTPSSNNQSGTVGANLAVSPSLRVNDQFGNPVPNVVVAFAVTGGGGSLNNTAATSGNATTNASGVALIPWKLGNTVGTNTLTAAAAGLGSSAVTFTATGVAGPATSIAIAPGTPTSQNQTTEANTLVPVAPSVRLTDQFNNAVGAGVVVRFAVTAGGGKVFANAADATGATSQDVNTNASGVATVHSWMLGAVGANTVRATVPAIATVTGFNIDATGITGNPTQIAVLTETPSSNNQFGSLNSNVSVAPAVLVRSAGGNPVPSTSVTFTVGSGGGTIVLTSGGASVTSGAIVTDANGVARIASWRMGSAVGANTLVAALTANGSVSTTLTATAVTTPSAPDPLTATAASSTQINLAWANVASEQGYRIERCTGASCSSFVEITTVAADVLTYQNTALAANTSYSYRVRAFNVAGASPYTSTASATTLNPPTAPTNLSAVAASTTQINLSWTDNSNNEDSFKVERCSGASCSSFTEIVSLAANTTTYQNTALTAGTSYSYRVRASNTGGFSSYSSTATAIPAAPTSDLDITSFTAPVSGKLGSSISVTTALRNSGGLATGAFRVGIYFSTDNNITTSDTPSSSICNISAGLAGGATTTCNGAITVPSLNPGSYFVGAIIDDQSAVTESVETNNSSTAVAITLANSDLVSNGSFSTGVSPWVGVGTAFGIGTSIGSNYRTAPGYAFVGGTSSETSGLYQDITIPASATNIALSFYTNITTDETTTSTAFDTFTITVRNTSGTILGTLVTLSNLNKDTGLGSCCYTQRTFNLNPYAGQTIRLYFNATLDSTLPTFFRIDDVSISWTAP